MCNKMKFTKAFPQVDLIPFLEEGAIPEQPSPTFDSELGISGCWFDLPGSVRSAGQGWVHCSDDPIRGTTNGPQVHTILHVVLLKLGQDVLAIGVLPKSRDVWPDLVHDNLPLPRLSHIDHLLDHIVGILILHHGV